MSKWISIKDQIPPHQECFEREYVLAYHTIHGVGVAWIWRFEDDGIVEELEEEFKDKYLCSGQFIKNRVDGNACIDDEDDIDIFENSPHFANLGTITHWMPLPVPPADNQCKDIDPKFNRNLLKVPMADMTKIYNSGTITHWMPLPNFPKNTLSVCSCSNRVFQVKNGKLYGEYDGDFHKYDGESYSFCPICGENLIQEM